MRDIPDDVRELLRDAWTLISRHPLRDVKVLEWQARFHKRMGIGDEFGDQPDADDVP